MTMNTSSEIFSWSEQVFTWIGKYVLDHKFEKSTISNNLYVVIKIVINSDSKSYAEIMTPRWFWLHGKCAWEYLRETIFCMQIITTY